MVDGGDEAGFSEKISEPFRNIATKVDGWNVDCNSTDQN